MTSDALEISGSGAGASLNNRSAATQSSWFHPTRLPLVPLAFLCAFAGLFAAGVLSTSHLLDLPVPCGTSGGCNAVATHPASKFLGVPIAFIGVAAYLAFIFLISRAAQARWARIVLFILAGIGAIASAGLLVYAKTVIQATCVWCVGSGAAMIALFALSILMVTRGAGLRTGSAVVFWTLALLTPTAVGVQAGMMRRAAYTPPIAAELLAGVSIDELMDDAKSIGPKDAPITVISFSDPWCPACSRMHLSLAKYQSTHSKSVRLVYRFMPLWQHSGAAAAIGEIAAEHGKFSPYIDAVHSGRVSPVRESYFRIMNELGIETFDLEERIADENDPAVLRVWRDRALGERLGITTTPTFIVILEGKPPTSANPLILLRLLNSITVPSMLPKNMTTPASTPPDASPIDNNEPGNFFIDTDDSHDHESENDSHTSGKHSGSTP